MTRAGFTIVELLIVVVVIAILAAITVVTYRNISDRANMSAATSEASQAAKKIQLYYTENDSYPTSLSAAGITNTNNLQYDYSNSASPKTFCITATSGNKSMKADSTKTTPTEGGCAGHGVGGVAAISNLADNPSFEATLSGWYENGGLPIVRTNEWSNSGGYSLLDTNTNGWAMQVRQSVGAPAVAGDIFSAQVTVRAMVNAQNISLWIDWFNTSNGLISNTAGPTINVPVDTTAILQVSGRTAPANTASARLRVRSATSPVGTKMFIDSVMLTKSSSPYTFADGNSPNWIWNGTPNNSTSTGPAL